MIRRAKRHLQHPAFWGMASFIFSSANAALILMTGFSAEIIVLLNVATTAGAMITAHIEQEETR